MSLPFDGADAVPLMSDSSGRLDQAAARIAHPLADRQFLSAIDVLMCLAEEASDEDLRIKTAQAYQAAAAADGQGAMQILESVLARREMTDMPWSPAVQAALAAARRQAAMPPPLSSGPGPVQPVLAPPVAACSAVQQSFLADSPSVFASRVTSLDMATAKDLVDLAARRVMTDPDNAAQWRCKSILAMALAGQRPDRQELAQLDEESFECVRNALLAGKAAQSQAHPPSASVVGAQDQSSTSSVSMRQEQAKPRQCRP